MAANPRRHRINLAKPDPATGKAGTGQHGFLCPPQAQSAPTEVPNPPPRSGQPPPTKPEEPNMPQLFIAVALALYMSAIDGIDRDAFICAAILMPLFVGVAVLA